MPRNPLHDGPRRKPDRILTEGEKYVDKGTRTAAHLHRSLVMPRFDVEVHFQVEAESTDSAFTAVDDWLDDKYRGHALPFEGYELLEGAATCQSGEYDNDLICTNCHVHLNEHD